MTTDLIRTESIVTYDDETGLMLVLLDDQPRALVRLTRENDGLLYQHFTLTLAQLHGYLSWDYCCRAIAREAITELTEQSRQLNLRLLQTTETKQRQELFIELETLISRYQRLQVVYEHSADGGDS